MFRLPSFTITIHLYGITTSNCPGEIFATVGEAKSAALQECLDAEIQIGRDALGIPLRATFAQVMPRNPVPPWCPLPCRHEHHSPVVVR